jgi:hypothetical protein
MIAKKLEVVLTQTAADTTTTVSRETGVVSELFNAVVPAYIRIEAGQTAIRTGVEPYSVKFTLSGAQSGIALVWGIVVRAGGCSVLTTKEWERPLIFPIMFDEEINFTVESVGTGLAVTGKFVIYYELQTFTELEMVQTIAGY